MLEDGEALQAATGPADHDAFRETSGGLPPRCVRDDEPRWPAFARITRSSAAGGRPSSQAIGCLYNSLTSHSTAMLGAPVRCSAGLGGRRRARASRMPATDRNGWSMPARVRRRGVVGRYRTTSSRSGSAGARARAKRNSPSHHRAGGTRTVLRRRATAPHRNRRNGNQDHWHAFARITPKLSGKRII